MTVCMLHVIGCQIVVNICRINFVMYALCVFWEAQPKRFPRYVTVELRFCGCHCLFTQLSELAKPRDTSLSSWLPEGQCNSL